MSKKIKYIGGQENTINIIESLPNCKREKGISINGDGTISIHTSEGYKRILQGDLIIIEGDKVNIESIDK